MVMTTPMLPRFAIHGPKGFVRAAMVFPGRRRGRATLEVSYAPSAREALLLCSRAAAQKLADLIGVHFDEPTPEVLELVTDDEPRSFTATARGC